MLVLTVSELNTPGNRNQRNYIVVTQSLKQVTLNIRRLQSGPREKIITLMIAKQEEARS